MLQNHVKNKEPERQELNELVEAFLAQGNEIQVLKSEQDPKPHMKVYANEPY